MTIGLLPIGRNTFDVPYAEERLAAMLNRLDASGRTFVGPRRLLFDVETTRAAIAEAVEAGARRLLVLQVTFTDAAMTVEAAATEIPMSIWALPEPRTGGRLRLNAFCGLNLASHALGLKGRRFSWVYRAPEALADGDLEALLIGAGPREEPPVTNPGTPTPAALRVTRAVSSRRIARIGAHPPGFDTCAYDASRLSALAGVEVDEFGLEQLFSAARASSPEAVAAVRSRAEADLAGLAEVDQDALDRSLRLKCALDDLCGGGPYGAVAIRCWPETFTEYGGAVCGPVSMMGEARLPCACEADVYGALTQMILSEASDGPVFLTDLVDFDVGDDSAVIWHCGQAPISMRDADAIATATIHTNRRMPLLYEFPLKPGRVTLMRISQAFGRPRMVLGGAEMLKRPMAFTGTSGVLRFDRPAGAVLGDLIAGGVEHHLAVAYGDHLAILRDVAAAMDLPVMEL